MEATITKVGKKNPTEIRKQLYETPNVELVDHCGVQLKKYIEEKVILTIKFQTLGFSSSSTNYLKI